jgi:hypothetical protein
MSENTIGVIFNSIQDLRFATKFYAIKKIDFRASHSDQTHLRIHCVISEGPQFRLNASKIQTDAAGYTSLIEIRVLDSTHIYNGLRTASSSSWSRCHWQNYSRSTSTSRLTHLSFMLSAMFVKNKVSRSTIPPHYTPKKMFSNLLAVRQYNIVGDYQP